MNLLGDQPFGDHISHLVGFPPKHPSHKPYSHGWFLDTHRAVFSAVLSPKTKVIIELGSWYGASTKWLAENSDAIIFAIDLWDDNFILADNHYMGSKLAQMLQEHPLYPTFLANTWEYRDRIVPLRMATTAGMQFLHDRGIAADLIYIDADHHYDAAKLDISTALRLFPGALLVGVSMPDSMTSHTHSFNVMYCCVILRMIMVITTMCGGRFTSAQTMQPKQVILHCLFSD
jgi:hypothetical protein